MLRTGGLDVIHPRMLILNTQNQRRLTGKGADERFSAPDLVEAKHGPLTILLHRRFGTFC